MRSASATIVGMKQVVVLTMALVACGGGKPKDDGEIKVPILDEQKAKGSASEPANVPVEEQPVAVKPEVAPLERVSAADLELPPKPAKAERERQAGIAWASASTGVDLAKQGKWPDASSKFRDAVARVPEAQYFFNLCVTLHQEGKFSEALTACDAVTKTGSKPELETKADRMMARIKTDAQQQGIKVSP